jgi:uncharacterized protein YxjI
MRYVMKQKLWSFGADFTIKDANGDDRFFVDGKALAIREQLSFQDMAGNELAYIKQRLLSWGPTFEISHGGRLVAVVKQKHWTLFRNRFTVDVGDDGASPNDLEVEGNFWDHEYTFQRGGQAVATVSKRYFSWTDTYGVDIAQGEDDVLILACTVVVDMATQKKNDD